MRVLDQVQLEVSLGLDGCCEAVRDCEVAWNYLQTECLIGVGGRDDGRCLVHIDAFVALEHYYLLK